MACSWDSTVERIFEYPILKRDEERKLFLLWKNEGDEKARKKLINSHLRLVLKIAREYTKNEEVTIELFEAGVEGLMKTIDRNDKKRFDPDHFSRARLATYAEYKIRTSITNTLQGWRREKRFFDVLSPSAPTVSAYMPLNGEAGTTILDMLPSDKGATGHAVEDAVIHELDRPKVLKIVQRAVKETPLSFRERTILQGRFSGEKTTFAILATRFGVSTQRICQIQAKALKKIRKRLKVGYPDLWEVMAVRGI